MDKEKLHEELCSELEELTEDTARILAIMDDRKRALKAMLKLVEASE